MQGSCTKIDQIWLNPVEPDQPDQACTKNLDSIRFLKHWFYTPWLTSEKKITFVLIYDPFFRLSSTFLYSIEMLLFSLT